MLPRESATASMEISVVIATFNGEDFLSEQIESILSQTRSPDEIIITDDNSSDQTMQIIKEYQESHPDIIKIFNSANNLGITRNFEQGIREASGEAIALSDQDDIWASNKLAQQVSQLSKTSDSLVFHNVETVDESLHHIGDHWENIGYKPGTTKEPKRAISRLVCGNYIKGSTIMIESSLMNDILPIPSHIGYDWYIGIMATILTGVTEINEKLQKWRLHDAQASDPGPRTVAQKIQRGINSEIDADHYRKRAAKWASIEQRIKSTNENQLCLQKNFIMKLIQDRYRYEQNRAIIYDQESNIFQSFSALVSNLQNKRYSHYGSAPSYLYPLKDGFYAL